MMAGKLQRPALQAWDRRVDAISDPRLSPRSFTSLCRVWNLLKVEGTIPIHFQVGREALWRSGPRMELGSRLGRGLLKPA